MDRPRSTPSSGSTPEGTERLGELAEDQPRKRAPRRVGRSVSAAGRTLVGSPRPRAENGRPGWYYSLAALFVGVTVYGFQQTAITPALPVVQRDLGASLEWTTWLLSGYFIVASVTPVFLGKLADRSGKRNIFLVALTVFFIGSVGAALAPSIELVVLCRLVQGVGGVVFPLSFAIVRDELPRARVATGIGILTGGFGLGSVGGYAIGGLITQFLGWRWIFWIGAIALALAIVAVRATLAASPTRIQRSLDLPGAALLGAALSGVIIGVTMGPGRGWTEPLTLGVFAFAIVSTLGWVYRELHTPEPLMDLRVLSSRPVLLTNAASLLSGYAAIGAGVLVTFLLQGETGSSLTAFGLTAGPLLTGLVLLPRALGQTIGGPATGLLARRFGYVGTFAGGMIMMTVGLAAIALWRTSLWMIVAELAVVGLGFGLAISVMGSLITLTADVSETSVAASINSVLRRVGGAIGAQVGVGLLATITIASTGEPSQAAFTAAFGVTAAMALAGTICAAFIKPIRRTRS